MVDSTRVAPSAAAQQPTVSGVAMPAAVTTPPPSAPPGAMNPAVLSDAARAAGFAVASSCDQRIAQVKRSGAASTAQMAADLKLGPTETQRFTELQEARAVAATACATHGASPVSAEQTHADLMAFLGPTRYEQMQEIMADRNARQNMATLMKQLSESGAPLNVDQMQRLTATILEENRRTRRETRIAVAPTDPRARLAYEQENLRLTEERYERTLKDAQTYLRPKQLAQLRGNMTRQTNALRSSVESMRASVDAGNGIPATQPTR